MNLTTALLGNVIKQPYNVPEEIKDEVLSFLDCSRDSAPSLLFLKRFCRAANMVCVPNQVSEGLELYLQRAILFNQRGIELTDLFLSRDLNSKLAKKHPHLGCIRNRAAGQASCLSVDSSLTHLR